MAGEFKPFADNAASASIGEFTIENGTERISFYGSLDIGRDKVGLENALKLKALVDQMVQVLKAAGQLPDRVPSPRKPPTIKNPFG